MIGAKLSAATGRLAAAIDTRDLTLYFGLSLVAYGLSLVWLPGAYIVPGAVLSAVAVFGAR